MSSPRWARSFPKTELLHSLIGGAGRAGTPARAPATENPTRGILVTKRDAGQFTVELSDHVPYGQTWEAVQLLDSAN